LLNINHFSRRATFYSKIRIILFKNHCCPIKLFSEEVRGQI